MPLLRKEISKLRNDCNNTALVDVCCKMLIKKHIEREDIPYLYELLIMPVTNSLKFLSFHAFHHVRTNWNDVDLLAATLNTSRQTAGSLLTNETIITSFPVVESRQPEEQEACLTLAMIIELKDENVFIYNDKKNDLSLISDLTGKNYFILFDRNFCDRSYMLAVATALMIRNKEVFSRFSFSGSISGQGQVEIVDNISLKEECCSKEGMKLIYGHFSLRELLDWLEDTPIPLPLGFIFGNSPSRDGQDKIALAIQEAIREVRPYFLWDHLERFYHLRPKELIIIEPEDLSFDRCQWMEIINQRMRPTINNAISAIPSDRRELHVFGTISSLMFAAGVMVKDYIPFTAWHYSQRKYYNVISTLGKNRSLKKRKDVSELKKITYTVEEPHMEMAVIVFFASHDMLNSVKRYMKSHHKNSGIIYINDQENQGNLPLDEDWSVYVNEVYNLLNHLKDNKDIRKFHFFFGCPIPVAFSLGAVIGSYWDIDAYQFNRQTNTYFKVYSLRDLE